MELNEYRRLSHYDLAQKMNERSTSSLIENKNPFQ